ncbi:MAG: hypothetical protein AB7K09_03060 [Planctomycetota bacterium]
MPIYDIGYQPWEGERLPVSQRWWPITRTGVRLAWQSKMLRRLIVIAWMPMAYYAVFFFAVGWVTDRANATSLSGNGLGMLMHAVVRGVFGETAVERIQANPEALRPVAWSVAFYVFFAITQGFLALLVVSIVGPPLVSRDLKSKAYLIYFSKPIPVWSYVVGKAGVLAFYMALITLFPAMLLYLLSIAFSPSLGAVLDTAPVILRLLAASVVLIVPVTLLVLYLSSITEDERVAVFTWLMIFVFGEIIYGVVSNNPDFARSDWIFLVSPRQTAMAVVAGIFDVGGQLKGLGADDAHRTLVGAYGPNAAKVGAIFLIGVSLLCIRGIARRVTAPVRI